MTVGTFDNRCLGRFACTCLQVWYNGSMVDRLVLWSEYDFIHSGVSCKHIIGIINRLTVIKFTTMQFIVLVVVIFWR